MNEFNKYYEAESEIGDAILLINPLSISKAILFFVVDPIAEDQYWHVILLNADMTWAWINFEQGKPCELHTT